MKASYALGPVAMFAPRITKLARVMNLRQEVSEAGDLSALCSCLR